MPSTSHYHPTQPHTCNHTPHIHTYHYDTHIIGQGSSSSSGMGVNPLSDAYHASTKQLSRSAPTTPTSTTPTPTHSASKLAAVPVVRGRVLPMPGGASPMTCSPASRQVSDLGTTLILIDNPPTPTPSIYTHPLPGIYNPLIFTTTIIPLIPLTPLITSPVRCDSSLPSITRRKKVVGKKWVVKIREKEVLKE